MTDAAFVGIVLCGGRSARMGVDKAVLDLGGRPMAARVATTLHRAGATEVLAVGGDARWAEQLVADGACHAWVPDLHPGEGPLGGVVTAAAARPGERLVVAACDLPELRDDLVRRLVTATTGRAAVPLVAGRRQWSLLGLPSHVAAAAHIRFAEGARALRDVDVSVHEVPAELADGLGDLDTPESVAAWRRRHGAER